MGGHPAPHIPQVIHGLFPSGVRVGGVSSGGIEGSDVDMLQPMDSLLAMPYEAYDIYSVGR